MDILIKGARVLDPVSGMDAVADVSIENGRISGVGASVEATGFGTVIDASGCYCMPGLIDLHVHFREPGFEYKETIRTGAAAAAAGGFTSVCPMANTNPPIDSPKLVSLINNKAKEQESCRIFPVGAITVGMKGHEVADLDAMMSAGACAFSEDGHTVMNASIYRDALRVAARLNVPVLDHCEDANLLDGGCFNAGPVAEKFGFKGISNAVEDVICARDIILAAETGARLHLCHVSTSGSVAMIRFAKKSGIRITAEACPHHFSLTCDDMGKPDTNYKMAPPLRSKNDVAAIRAGLADGTIDAIATDHAPHSEIEKKKPFAVAPNGIVGLETAIPLVITQLVEQGFLTPLEMADRMSTKPAMILGKKDLGRICAGAVADVTIIDPSCEYAIDSNTFVSKGRNTPFNGMRVRGRAVCTIMNGRITHMFRG